MTRTGGSTLPHGLGIPVPGTARGVPAATPVPAAGLEPTAAEADHDALAPAGAHSTT